MAGEARRRRQRSALLNLRLVGVGSDEPDAESAAPAEYIYREQSSRQLATLVPVEIGRRNGLEAQILSGLEATGPG